jgi:hypothetical protein
MLLRRAERAALGGADVEPDPWLEAVAAATLVIPCRRFQKVVKGKEGCAAQAAADGAAQATAGGKDASPSIELAAADDEARNSFLVEIPIRCVSEVRIRKAPIRRQIEQDDAKRLMKTLTNVALLCKFLSDQGRYIELFTKNVALEHSDVAQCTTTFDALAAAAKRKSSTEFVVRLAVLEKELTAWKTAQKRHTDAVMTVDASDGGCEKAKKELMLGIKKLKAEVAAYTRDGGGAAADDAASGDENDVTWLGTKSAPSLR